MPNVNRNDTPLERAMAHERTAAYSTLFVASIIAVLTAIGAVIHSQNASEHERWMREMLVAIQLIVMFLTLSIARHQVSVAVRQIEQSHTSELQLIRLAESIDQISRPSPLRNRAL